MNSFVNSLLSSASRTGRSTEAYTKASRRELDALVQEREMKGTSRLNKTELIAKLLEYDTLLGVGFQDELDDHDARANTASKVPNNPPPARPSTNQAVVLATAIPTLEDFLLKTPSKNVVQALKILQNEDQASISDTEMVNVTRGDDVKIIAMLFRELRILESTIPLLASPANAFVKIKATLKKQWESRHSVVELMNEGALAIFAMFDIQVKLVDQTTIRPSDSGIDTSAIDSQIISDISEGTTDDQACSELFHLQQGLLEFLSRRAKQVPEESRKYPYSFTMEERTKLSGWFNRVCKVLDLDSVGAEGGGTDAKEMDKKLIDLFNADVAVNGISTSVKVTESIIKGLRQQRMDNRKSRERETRKRKRASLDQDEVEVDQER